MADPGRLMSILNLTAQGNSARVLTWLVLALRESERLQNMVIEKKFRDDYYEKIKLALSFPKVAPDVASALSSLKGEITRIVRRSNRGKLGRNRRKRAA